MHRRPLLLIAALLTSAISACSSSAGGPTAGSHGVDAASVGPTTMVAPATSRSTSSTSAHALLHNAHPGAAVLAGHGRPPASTAFVPSLSAAADDFAGTALTCQVDQSSSTVRICLSGDTTAPRRTVAVVGDSVAGQWLPPLEQIASERHWRLAVITHSRCPFSATTMVNLGEKTPYTSCLDWGRKALATVLRMKPAALITSERPVLGTPDHAPHTAAANRAIATGMARYWRTLLAHHIAVVAIRESPEMGRKEPACLRGSHGDPHPCTVARSEALPANPPQVLAARAVPKAVLVDMSDLICAPSRCSPIVGNVLVYRDNHHITATYAHTTTPYLAAKLDAVAALR